MVARVGAPSWGPLTGVGVSGVVRFGQVRTMLNPVRFGQVPTEPRPNLTNPARGRWNYGQVRAG